MPMVRLVQAFIYIRNHVGDNQYARPVPFVPIFDPATKKVHGCASLHVFLSWESFGLPAL